jgi:hypothetical protein
MSASWKQTDNFCFNLFSFDRHIYLLLPVADNLAYRSNSQSESNQRIPSLFINILGNYANKPRHPIDLFMKNYSITENVCQDHGARASQHARQRNAVLWTTLLSYGNIQLLDPRHTVTP